MLFYAVPRSCIFLNFYVICCKALRVVNCLFYTNIRYDTIRLSSASTEDSALVHCARNTVQLLQRYRVPFSWTMPPIVPIGERIDYKTYEVIQQRECESWVKKIEEIKQLVEFKQCTKYSISGENVNFRVSPFYQVVQKHKLFLMWHIKVSFDYILYRQHFPKKYQNPSQRWDVFWDTVYSERLLLWSACVMFNEVIPYFESG